VFPAILADTYAHQFAETQLGLPPDEVRRRTARYLPKAIERCINANLDEVSKKLCTLKPHIKYAILTKVEYDEKYSGEYGLYLHQEYDLPQLTIVPWFETAL